MLSQPGILPAEMPVQHEDESAWQLPVPKSCQILSRILGLPLGRKYAGCELSALARKIVKIHFNLAVFFSNIFFVFKFLNLSRVTFF